MKKITIACFMLTWALLLPLIAAGESVIPDLWGVPTEQPQPSAFSFRAGVQWNMSKEQVKALEATDLTERNNGEWSVLIPLSPVEVSRYTADLVYMFRADQLKMIQYDFGVTGTELDFAYLCGALDSVYGEHIEPEAHEIIRIMDQIYPTYYKSELVTNQNGWTAADGTKIYLFYYSPNAYTILYSCADDGIFGLENYITTGL